MAKFSSPPAGPLAAGLESDFCRCRLEVLHVFQNFTPVRVSYAQDLKNTPRRQCPGSVFSRQATRDARTRPAPSPLTRPSSVEPRLAALGELAERDVSVGVERRRHVRRRERVRLERGPVQLRHPTRRPHGRLQPRRVLGVAYSPVGCCVCVSCLACVRVACVCVVCERASCVRAR